MAHSQTELTERLQGLEHSEPFAVYYQPPTKMSFPCIKFERDNTKAFRADDVLYFYLKRYSVTVIDRNPDSALPDRVEELPHAAFDRFYIVDGLNHWVFTLHY